MPNWIEGTMKLRGKAENIGRFFSEGLDSDVSKNEYGGSVEYVVPDGVYINDSRRAFTNGAEWCYIDTEEASEQVVSFPVKQAWSFTPDESGEKRWCDLSEKYGIDVRLQGFECGMQFYQDLEISKGTLVRNECKEYDDWEWDCPFPNMGG